MKIDNYSFGKVVIDEKTYTKDVIVFQDSVKENWHRKEGHLATAEDLKDVWAKKPDKLIIGTGAFGVIMVDKSAREKAKELGIELIIDKTAKACFKFNKEKGNVVLAIHLTC